MPLAKCFRVQLGTQQCPGIPQEGTASLLGGSLLPELGACRNNAGFYETSEQLASRNSDIISEDLGPFDHSLLWLHSFLANNSKTFGYYPPLSAL